MSGKHLALYRQFHEEESAQGPSCEGPVDADRCVVCGDLVDPFTKCANLEPSNVCLDCRMAPAQTVPVRKAA